jgi:hypothetical protein
MRYGDIARGTAPPWLGAAVSRENSQSLLSALHHWLTASNARSMLRLHQAIVVGAPRPRFGSTCCAQEARGVDCPTSSQTVWRERSSRLLLDRAQRDPIASNRPRDAALDYSQ